MKEMTERSNFTFKKLLEFFIGDKSKKQFIRYLITGVSSFVIEYFLFFLLFKVLSIYELVANTVVITIVFWFNFLMNRHWSFQSKEKLGRQLLMYLALFMFNAVISNLFIYTGVTILEISPLISKVLIMCLIVTWNFVIYKKVIYKS